MAQDKDKIIIAIDFGTTYSGIGWLHPAIPQSVENGGKVVQFVNKLVSNDKVPTEILYEDGSSGGNKWGWAAQGNPKSEKYFKLKLDPTQGDKLQKLQDIEYPSSSQVQNRPFQFIPRIPKGKRVLTAVHKDKSIRKSTADISTDYLRLINAAAIEDITKSLGKEVVDMTPKQYVLTVPAVWSPQAKNATKQCAMNAFGENSRIEIIAEPQAAAIFTLNQKGKLKALKPKGHYVVCDAGGGTVDLVTYQVLGTDPLELGVSGRGTGDVCGSLFLNRRFEDFLANKIGRCFRYPENKAMEKAWNRMRNDFEIHIKRNFKRKDEEFGLQLPSGIQDIEYSEEDELIVKGEEIAEIFEPVVSQILTLIEEQIRIVKRQHSGATIAGILLVGGLGQSPYLMKKVEEKFSHIYGYETLQPTDGWSAVVRGALLWGHDHGTVTKDVARRSYGHELTVDWKPGRELIAHPVTGRDSCKEMEWLVTAGTEITRKVPAASNVAMTCGKQIADHLKIILWAWDPPPGSASTETGPEVRDQNCYKVGELKAPLDWLQRKSKAELAQFEDNRGQYYNLKFRLELLFSAEISFKAKFDKGPETSVTINYDPEDV